MSKKQNHSFRLSSKKAGTEPGPTTKIIDNIQESILLNVGQASVPAGGTDAVDLPKQVRYGARPYEDH